MRRREYRRHPCPTCLAAPTVSELRVCGLRQAVPYRAALLVLWRRTVGYVLWLVLCRAIGAAPCRAVPCRVAGALPPLSLEVLSWTFGKGQRRTNTSELTDFVSGPLGALLQEIGVRLAVCVARPGASRQGWRLALMSVSMCTGNVSIRAGNAQALRIEQS